MFCQISSGVPTESPSIKDEAFFKAILPPLDEILGKPVSYVFVVVRNNVVETVKVFKDASDAVPYTDNFIMNIDNSITFANLPRYSENEHYSKDGLTIGLYIC